MALDDPRNTQDGQRLSEGQFFCHSNTHALLIPLDWQNALDYMLDRYC